MGVRVDMVDDYSNAHQITTRITIILRILEVAFIIRNLASARIKQSRKFPRSPPCA